MTKQKTMTKIRDNKENPQQIINVNNEYIIHSMSDKTAAVAIKKKVLM